MAESDKPAEWDQLMHEFHETADSVYEIVLFTPREMPWLIDAMESGDKEARVWFEALNEFMERSMARTEKECICCGCQMGDEVPSGVAFVSPAREDKTVTCGTILCEPCAAREPKERMKAIYTGVSRTMFYEEGRLIEINEQTGHA